jgi:hypothetical protein
LIGFKSISGQHANVIEVIVRGRYRFRKDKLKISVIDHLYRYRLAVDKERVPEHFCLVPLIVSGLQRERHVITRERLPIRKLQAISKPDVDRTVIGARGPRFGEARHITLRRMIELHEPAVEQEERR